jgi:ADP-ribose pyrophosphatase
MSLYKRLSQKTVYQCPWMTVTEHQAVRRGDEAVTYSVVDRADGVLVIPMSPPNDSKIQCTLLQRQDRFPLQAEDLEFPAGAIDPGETPENAAVRELFEETGIVIQPKNLVFLAAPYVISSLTKQRMYLFTVEVSEEDLAKAAKVPVSEDIVSQQVATFEEVDGFIQDGQICEMANLVAWAYLRHNLPRPDTTPQPAR